MKVKGIHHGRTCAPPNLDEIDEGIETFLEIRNCARYTEFYLRSIVALDLLYQDHLESTTHSQKHVEDFVQVRAESFAVIDDYVQQIFVPAQLRLQDNCHNPQEEGEYRRNCWQVRLELKCLVTNIHIFFPPDVRRRPGYATMAVMSPWEAFIAFFAFTRPEEESLGRDHAHGNAYVG